MCPTGEGSACSSCPANSYSAFSAQRRSSCMCNSGDKYAASKCTLTDVSVPSGYFYDAARGECQLCPNSTYSTVMKLKDNDFKRNGSMGWRGTERTTSCGAYGSVLGGLHVLAEHSSIEKTFTRLCKHVSVYVQFKVLLIDVIQPVKVGLYINREEVWSQTLQANRFSGSECGWSEGDGIVSDVLRVNPREDYVEAKLRVDYDYWEVNASNAKTFWGLQEFRLFVPCMSSTSADCTMTTPSRQTCSDVTVNGEGSSCIQSGDFLYVQYPYRYLSWEAAESKCNELGIEGHLAYFPDAETYDDVAAAFGLSFGWIGLRSRGGPLGFDFRWYQGEAPTFSRFEYFAYRDSYKEFCVYASGIPFRQTDWDVSNCRSSRSTFVCSYLAMN